jgi:predicted Zn-dependent protease
MLYVRVSGLDRETDHADLLADVDTLVGKYPNDAGVLTLAAEAYFSAERITESESLIERALAANPQLQRALAIKGAITLFSTARKGEVRRGKTKSKRSWILKANKSNPDDPLPLYYFSGRFFRRARSRPRMLLLVSLLRINSHRMSRS